VVAGGTFSDSQGVIVREVVQQDYGTVIARVAKLQYEQPIEELIKKQVNEKPRILGGGSCQSL